jgi:predicted RNA-binding Zn-ribbon protein involved in translation (DUF1610 family)
VTFTTRPEDDFLFPGEALAVRCRECRRQVDEFTAIAERWVYWSDGSGELLPFCPECGAREFGPDAPARGRLPLVLCRAASSSGSSS